MKLQKGDVGCKVFTKYDLEFPRQENRYFFGLCPVLLLPDANAGENALKACSGCYSVCYSGREAQKKHWKQHKPICKALQPLGNAHGALENQKSAKLHSLIRGVLIQSCSTGAKKFTNYVLSKILKIVVS